MIGLTRGANPNGLARCYVYVYVYVYVFLSIYLSIYIYIYIYLSIYLYLYLYIYISISISMYIYGHKVHLAAGGGRCHVGDVDSLLQPTHTDANC